MFNVDTFTLAMFFVLRIGANGRDIIAEHGDLMVKNLKNLTVNPHNLISQ